MDRIRALSDDDDPDNLIRGPKSFKSSVHGCKSEIDFGIPQSDGYDHQIMAMLDLSANSRGDLWVPLACDLHAFADGLGMSTTLSSQGNFDVVHVNA